MSGDAPDWRRIVEDAGADPGIVDVSRWDWCRLRCGVFDVDIVRARTKWRVYNHTGPRSLDSAIAFALAWLRAETDRRIEELQAARKRLG